MESSKWDLNHSLLIMGLKTLFNVTYSRSEISAQRSMPENQESEPLSIPPMTPKKARKSANAKADFSSFIAAEQVSMPIREYIKETSPSIICLPECSLVLVL